MTTRIEQLGDGLAVRIPAEMAAELGLTAETPVDVATEAGRLVVTPPGERRPTFDELLARITPENRHGETDWGPPVGNEAW